jgi:hypothetical protein
LRSLFRGARALIPRLGILSLLAASGLLLATNGGERQASAALSGTYSFGVENSWLRVQNIGTADAAVEVEYFDEQGRIAGKDVCPSTACPALFPGSGWTFFQKGNPSLVPGFQGSAIVSTDQPIVALLAKDVVRGIFFSIAGDTVIAGPGSHRIYLPLTAKRDGPLRDWMGRFAIQNMSDTALACVTITYLSNYTDGEIAWDPFRPPPPATPTRTPTPGTQPGRLPGCPYGGMPLPPRGTIFRDVTSMNVPDGFTGSVRIDLHTNGAGQGPDKQFISATADTWNQFFYGFASYRGFDENELGREIVLPLVDRQVGPANSYSTHFQIVNKDPERPAQIALRFDGFDLSGPAPQFVSKANTITVKGARLCFQDRDDFANCLAPGDRLPFNFVGTVSLTSSEPIAVVVNRSTSIADTFTNYRGIRPQDGARRVLLPVLNKNHGSIPGVANGWNSWFRVMVADGGRANVTVRYFGLDLPGGSVAYTVTVDREFTVFQYLEPFLPNGFAGTAVIESDRPIVALANLTTDVFAGDPDLLYNGIALE